MTISAIGYKVLGWTKHLLMLAVSIVGSSIVLVFALWGIILYLNRSLAKGYLPEEIQVDRTLLYYNNDELLWFVFEAVYEIDEEVARGVAELGLQYFATIDTNRTGKLEYGDWKMGGRCSMLGTRPDESKDSRSLRGVVSRAPSTSPSYVASIGDGGCVMILPEMRLAYVVQWHD